jgi:hypothetical protein
MASTLVFGSISVVRLLHLPSCCDFIRAYGFPLAFFIEGGFAGIKKFILSGFVVDLVVLVAFAGAVSWTWKRLSERTPSHARNQ